MNELPSEFSSLGALLLLSVIAYSIGRIIANRMSKK